MIILLAALGSALAISEKCQGGARQLTLEEGGGSFAVVEVSRAKGGASWLAAFGETRVRIESRETPIRVIHGLSRLETDRIGESYWASFMSAVFDDASKTFTASWSPFQDHFIRVKPLTKTLDTMFGASLAKEHVCYSTKLRMFSLSRVVPLIFGLALFFNAKKMSRNIGFHYAGGVTSGIALAAFVALFMLARLLPMKRNMLLSIWAGGSSLLMWAGTRFQDQVLELLQAYPWIFSIYLVGAAGFSYCICFYYEDQLRNDKVQKMAGWLLQLIGLVSILISSWRMGINIAIVTILLVREFALFSQRHIVDWKRMRYRPRNETESQNGAGDQLSTTPIERKPADFFPRPVSTPRSNFFSPLRIFQRKASPVSIKKFLTPEEYEEQGRLETEKQLANLQTAIKNSPEPLQLMSKLSKETVHKVINFSLNGSHINDSDEDEELSTGSDDELCEKTYTVNRHNGSGYHPSPVRDNRASNLRRQVLQKQQATSSRIPKSTFR